MWILCSCVCSLGMTVEVSGQHEEVNSLLPYKSQGSNLGLQAWWQALLPTEPSYWPLFHFSLQAMRVAGTGHFFPRLTSLHLPEQWCSGKQLQCLQRAEGGTINSGTHNAAQVTLYFFLNIHKPSFLRIQSRIVWVNPDVLCLESSLSLRTTFPARDDSRYFKCLCHFSSRIFYNLVCLLWGLYYQSEQKHIARATLCVWWAHIMWNVIIDYPKLVLQTQSLRVSSRSCLKDLWQSVGFCEIIWSVRVFRCMYVWVYMEARGQSNAVPLEPLPHQTRWPVSTASLHHPANPTTSHILLCVLGIKLRSLCFGGQTISTVPMDDIFFTAFPPRTAHPLVASRLPVAVLVEDGLERERKHEGNVSVRSLWNCHRCFFTHLQEMNDGRVLCFLDGCYLSIGTKEASLLLSLHTKVSKANICLESVARNNCWRAVWGY